ncbi:cell wall hydrolase [Paenibacillus sp. PL2-23]|uniref:cell wall hydrolase n=1 Tax=Paenibacillus sp. PL2-23 TaxID=2100729 RepID=UPI0030F7CCE2
MDRGYKRSGRRFIIAIWAMLLLSIMPLSALAAQGEAAVATDVTIKLDGEALKLADPIRKLDGRLFLPAARVAELFGAKITWNAATQEATLHTKLGDKVVFGDEVPVVYFNEGRYLLTEPPFIAEGRIYIPLRDAAELLHAKVKWNDAENTAELTTVEAAVVTEGYGLADISVETGSSSAALLARNELDAGAELQVGAKVRVVIPSVLSRPAKAFTEEDYWLLAKITQVEAGNESYEGQLGVANVILNRMKDARFPGTIKGVIYSGKQFPPAHNGLLDKSKPNASVLRAAKDALNGKNNVQNAVYFFNPKVSKSSFFKSLDVVVTIGHHSFAK